MMTISIMPFAILIATIAAQELNTLQNKHRSQTSNHIQVPHELRQSILAEFSNRRGLGKKSHKSKSLKSSNKGGGGTRGSKSSKSGKSRANQPVATTIQGSKGTKSKSSKIQSSETIGEIEIPVDSSGETRGDFDFTRTSSAPTIASSPSSSPSLHFELSECSTYDHYW